MSAAAVSGRCAVSAELLLLDDVCCGFIFTFDAFPSPMDDADDDEDDGGQRGDDAEQGVQHAVVVVGGTCPGRPHTTMIRQQL